MAEELKKKRGREVVEGGYMPEMGSFPVLEIFKPTVSDIFRTSSPYGLNYNTSWLTVILEDESGKRSKFIITYFSDSCMPTIATYDSDDVNALPEKVFAKRTYAGLISSAMQPGGKSFVVKPVMPMRNGFRIEFFDEAVTVNVFDGVLDVKGKSAAPALIWHIAGRGECTAYYSSPFHMEGTLYGSKVEGYGHLDVAWGPSGVGWCDSKVYRFLEEEWGIFHNTFGDGSYQGGIVVAGVDKFKYIYYYEGADKFNCTKAVCSNEVEEYVSFDERKALQAFTWMEFFPPEDAETYFVT